MEQNSQNLQKINESQEYLEYLRKLKLEAELQSKNRLEVFENIVLLGRDLNTYPLIKKFNQIIKKFNQKFKNSKLYNLLDKYGIINFLSKGKRFVSTSIFFLPRLIRKTYKWISREVAKLGSQINQLIKKATSYLIKRLFYITKIPFKLLKIPFKLLKGIYKRLRVTKWGAFIAESLNLFVGKTKDIISEKLNILKAKLVGRFRNFTNRKNKQRMAQGKNSKGGRGVSSRQGRMFGSPLSTVFAKVMAVGKVIIGVTVLIMALFWFVGYEDIRTPTTYNNNTQLPEHLKTKVVITDEDNNYLQNQIQIYQEEYDIVLSQDEINHLNYAIADFENLIGAKLKEDQQDRYELILEYYLIIEYDEEKQPIYYKRDFEELVNIFYEKLQQIDQTQLLIEFEADFKHEFIRLAYGGAVS